MSVNPSTGGIYQTTSPRLGCGAQVPALAAACQRWLTPDQMYRSNVRCGLVMYSTSLIPAISRPATSHSLCAVRRLRMKPLRLSHAPYGRSMAMAYRLEPSVNDLGGPCSTACAALKLAHMPVLVLHSRLSSPCAVWPSRKPSVKPKRRTLQVMRYGCGRR